MAKICPNCSAEVNEQNQFCTVCGTRLDQQPLEAAPVDTVEPAVPEIQEPSEAPARPVMPVLTEQPVYSVNNVRPAESRYTVPAQPYAPQYAGAPQYAPYAPAAPAPKKKHTALLAFLVTFLIAAIAILAFFAVSLGWFTDKHQLDGDYKLSGFTSGGVDYSSSIASVSDSYTLSIRGDECTMVLGEESDTYRYTVDQARHTLSNGTGVTSFTVSETGGSTQITIPSDNNVMTFTRR